MRAPARTPGWPLRRPDQAPDGWPLEGLADLDGVIHQGADRDALRETVRARNDEIRLRWAAEDAEAKWGEP